MAIRNIFLTEEEESFMTDKERQEKARARLTLPDTQREPLSAVEHREQIIGQHKAADTHAMAELNRQQQERKAKLAEMFSGSQATGVKSTNIFEGSRTTAESRPAEMRTPLQAYHAAREEVARDERIKSAYVKPDSKVTPATVPVLEEWQSNPIVRQYGDIDFRFDKERISGYNSYGVPLGESGKQLLFYSPSIKESLTTFQAMETPGPNDPEYETYMASHAAWYGRKAALGMGYIQGSISPLSLEKRLAVFSGFLGLDEDRYNAATIAKRDSEKEFSQGMLLGGAIRFVSLMGATRRPAPTTAAEITEGMKYMANLPLGGQIINTALQSALRSSIIAAPLVAIGLMEEDKKIGTEQFEKDFNQRFGIAVAAMSMFSVAGFLAPRMWNSTIGPRIQTMTAKMTESAKNKVKGILWKFSTDPNKRAVVPKALYDRTHPLSNDQIMATTTGLYNREKIIEAGFVEIKKGVWFNAKSGSGEILYEVNYRGGEFVPITDRIKKSIIDPDVVMRPGEIRWAPRPSTVQSATAPPPRPAGVAPPPARPTTGMTTALDPVIRSGSSEALAKTTSNALIRMSGFPELYPGPQQAQVVQALSSRSVYKVSRTDSATGEIQTSDREMTGLEYVVDSLSSGRKFYSQDITDAPEGEPQRSFLTYDRPGDVVQGITKKEYSLGQYLQSHLTRDDLQKLSMTNLPEYMEKAYASYMLSLTPNGVSPVAAKVNGELSNTTVNRMLNLSRPGDGTIHGRIDYEKADPFAGLLRRPTPGSLVKKIVDNKYDFINSKEPVRMKDLQNYISETFQIPISEGFISGSARAQYDTHSYSISLERAKDVPAIMHEVGHHISQTWGDASPTVDGSDEVFYELEMLGARNSENHFTPQQVREEGISEFVRLYAMHRDSLKTTAPKTLEVFAERLAEDPDLARTLNTIRTALANHEALTPEGRLLSNIKNPEVPGFLKRVFGDERIPLKTKLMMTIFDRDYRIKEVVREATGDRSKYFLDVPTELNPYLLKSILHATGNVAKVALELHVTDRDGNIIFDKSLNEILSKAESMDDLRAYITAATLIERYEKGLAEKLGDRIRFVNAGKEYPSIPYKDLIRVRDKFFDKYDSIAKEMISFQQAVLQRLVGGWISQESYELLTTTYEYSFPMQHDMPDLRKGGKRDPTLLENVNPVIYSLSGGTGEDILDPLHMFVDRIVNIFEIEGRTDVLHAMYNLYKRYSGLGKFMQEVDPAIGRETIQLAPMNKKMEELLIMLGADKEATEAVNWANLEPIELFKLVGADPAKKVLAIPMGAETKYLKINDPGLWESLISTPLTSDMLSPVLRAFSKVLRTTALYNPIFPLFNITRDAFLATVTVPYKYIPGYDTMRGLFAAVGHGELWEAFYNSGGGMSAMGSMDVKSVTEFMQKIEAENLWDYYSKRPVRFMRDAGIVSELATKISAFDRGTFYYLKKHNPELFKKVVKDGKIDYDALRGTPGLHMIYKKVGYMAADSSGNKSKGGQLTQLINMFRPFINAQVSTIRKIVEDFSSPDTANAAWLKTLFLLVGPSIALHLYNRNDPRYQELSAWEKDLHWVFLTEDKMIFVRRPFVLGPLCSLADRAVEFILSEDPYAFDGGIQSLSRAIIPSSVMMQATAPMIEAVSNYSFFYDGAIVPRAEENLPPAEQYGPKTSEFSKALGKMFGWSPRKIDHVIFGYTSRYGKAGLDIIDVVVKTAGIADKSVEPARQIEDMPILKHFFRRAYENSHSINLFYNRLGELEQLSTQRDLYLAESQELTRLRRARADMAKIRNTITEVYESETLSPEQKRTELDCLNLQLVNVARPAIGRKRIN